jgi:uncharacterized delta-60 repeat protein
LAYAGGLDSTFGGGRGYYLAPVAAGVGTGLVDLTSVAVEPDGSVLAAGPAGKAGSESFGVIRVRADGAPDTSFGRGGEADVVPPGGPSFVVELGSLLVQPDGKLILSGRAYPSATSSQFESVVVRLDLNGSPDPTFGTSGVVVIDPIALGAPDPYLPYAALQADGKVVLAGTSTIPKSPLSNAQVTAIRLNPDGILDRSFGTNGLVTISDIPPGDLSNIPPPVESTEGVAVQPDGRVVILASISGLHGPVPPNSTPELIRLNADGSRDASLSQVGVVASGVSYPRNYGLIVQPDGKFLVLGGDAEVPFNKLVLARVNADGTLDRKATLPAPGVFLASKETGFALQSDGKVVVTGNDIPPATGSTNFFETVRFTAGLTPDATFGLGGISAVAIVPPPPTGDGTPAPSLFATEVAVGPDDRAVLIGSNPSASENIPASYYAVARLTSTGSAHPGDFTGDGIADPAVYLPAYGSFAIRPSQGGPDEFAPFGLPGPGQTIPASGDYTGSGVTEIAAYLPALGIYAYRPAGGGPDVLAAFGIKGAVQTIPAPGDYFGTGQDDLAVYLPALGEFGLRDPRGGTDQLIPFGISGPGGSIPVPGDYDGSGKTELAVYLPSLGAFAYRPANGGPDVITRFGIPGAGQSIPMPGDYDGSGKTELAVYLPSLGEFIYRPANGGTDVAMAFGIAGAGQTIAAQGDYTGSGRTDLGVYLPSLGEPAFRPAGGGPDVRFRFGIAGAGQTIPVMAVVQSPFPGAEGLPLGSLEALSIPGDFDPLDLMPLTTKKKAKPGEVSTSAPSDGQG